LAAQFRGQPARGFKEALQRFLKQHASC
jgi:hypothetical protein